MHHIASPIIGLDLRLPWTSNTSATGTKRDGLQSKSTCRKSTRYYACNHWFLLMPLLYKPWLRWGKVRFLASQSSHTLLVFRAAIKMNLAIKSWKLILNSFHIAMNDSKIRKGFVLWWGMRLFGQAVPGPHCLSYFWILFAEHTTKRKHRLMNGEYGEWFVFTTSLVFAC